MKKLFLPYLVIGMSLLSLSVFSQDKDQTKNESKVDTTNKLNLPGDNLDLYAVLDLFQKSKTIEGFEKSLNDSKTQINNLDLNLDKKVDFIKVTTAKEGDSSYRFVLQVDVTKTETQDVAVIYLNKEKGRVSLQMVGDEELYGKDYVIEPKGNSSVTANPGYTGENPVTVNVPAQTVTVVQSAPIVQYVYSPAYVPYYPPYYYGYYPGWFAFTAVVSWGIYANHWGHYHGGYYGGHYGGNNTVIINNGNRNSINHYNNSRNTSNTVSNNMAKGNYGNRPSTSDRASTSNRASTNNVSNNKASTSNRASTNNLSNNKASTNNLSNNRTSTNNISSNRTSTSNFSSRSNMSAGGGRTMGSSRSMGGGGGRRR